MEFSGGGWPVWSEDFAPYGQEIAPQTTANNYKFTGYQRDSETGNDYASQGTTPAPREIMNPDPVVWSPPTEQPAKPESIQLCVEQPFECY